MNKFMPKYMKSPLKYAILATIASATTHSFYAQAQGILEEVIVTSQKRTQGLQDVPISVSAITGDSLDKSKVFSSKELATLVPGLEWSGTANFSRPQVFLRGIGSAAYTDNETTPVAIYFDEVYQGSSVNLAVQLMDLERVEVLKGPQGTLWGKNATAGLIHYISRKPNVGEEASGSASVTAAEYGEKSIEGAASFPISDTVAARISAKHSDRDGAVDAVGSGFQGDYGGWDWNSLRAQLVIEPNERLSIRPKISWNEASSDPFNGGKSLGLWNPDGSFDFGATPCPGAGTLGANCGDILDNTGYNAANGQPNASVSTGDIYETEVEFRGFEDSEALAASVNTTYDLDKYTVTAILSYSEFDRQYHADTDFTDSPIATSMRETEFDSYSAEFRLANNSGQKLEWTAGLYAYTDNLDTSICEGFDPFGLAFGGSLPTSCVATITSTETETVAAFLDGTYQFTDQLSLTAGIRYTYDKRSGLGQGFSYTGPTNTYKTRDEIIAERVNPYLVNQKSEESWTEPTGRVVLTYQADDDFMVFASVAKGFKGGDYSGTALQEGVAFIPSDPEYSVNYEVGMKSEWFESSLRVNLAAYYNQFTDKQVLSSVQDSGTGQFLDSLVNAGELDIYGAEAEVVWLPTTNMNVSFNVAYIDSEYKDLKFNSFGPQDFSGNTTENTPELSFSGVIGYVWPMDSGAEVSVEVNANWTDEVFFGLSNNPQIVRDDLWLFGGNIGYTDADGVWDFRLWGKNLGDEEYFSGGFDLAFIGQNLLNVADPRTLGATVTYNF